MLGRNLFHKSLNNQSLPPHIQRSVPLILNKFAQDVRNLFFCTGIFSFQHLSILTIYTQGKVLPIASSWFSDRTSHNSKVVG